MPLMGKIGYFMETLPRGKTAAVTFMQHLFACDVAHLVY
jgi:hypothetical protein